MKRKLKKCLGLVLVAAVLCSTALACDDRSGDGCIATPPSSGGNPAYTGDWGDLYTMGGVVAFLGFLAAAVQIVELDLPPAF